MLSNLTALEELNVDGGIIGPLVTESFAGLTKLKRMIIRYTELMLLTQLFGKAYIKKQGCD